MKHYHRKIVTILRVPTYPAHDWLAYDDGLVTETSPYGYGKTEREAVDDLMSQLEEME